MFDDAVELFSRVSRLRCEPSVEILNALLSVLCKNEKGSEIVPIVLFKSQEMKIRIEESTFEILIRALCRIGNAVKALELLNQMAEEGFDVDDKVCSLMLATMCRRRDCGGGEVLGFLEELKRLGFEPRRDDFLNLIRALVKRGKGMKALGLLRQMRLNGVEANIISYNLVLDALICDEEFSTADKVFDEMLVLGLVPDINTYNVYINGLCLQEKVEDGISLLHSMEELGCAPDATTYSVILRALCEAGELGWVREMMNEMQQKCRRLNQDMYEIVIAGFVSDGDVEGACSLIDEMMDENLTRRRSKSLDEIMCWLWKTGLHCRAEKLLQKWL